MKEYTCDFWIYNPINDIKKHIKDYKIKAKNKKEVIAQIKKDYIIINNNDIWIN
jgi:hypothetical protein